MGIIEELIAKMRGLPRVEPPPTAVVPPSLHDQIMAACPPDFRRRMLIEICGVPIVAHPGLEGFGEWLLVPHGRSVELEVALYLVRKSREPLRQTGRMHGLREAAMEVEP